MYKIITLTTHASLDNQTTRDFNVNNVKVAKLALSY